MMRKRVYVALLITVCAGILFACGPKESAPDAGSASDPGPVKKVQVSKDPVTLKFLIGAGIAMEEVEVLFMDPVKKKYPNISFEVIRAGKGSQLIDLIGAGNIPDLVMSDNTNIGSSYDYGVLFDHTELIRMLGINLERLDPVVVNGVRDALGDGLIYGLPYFQQFNALYYNKDIFDKFGVSYPKDGLTWDETVELARRLTRQDGGVQYKGLHYENVYRLAMPLSPDFVDRVSLKATVNNEMWKKVFDLGYRINNIPGNKPPRVDNGYTNAFFKEKNTAMLATTSILGTFRDTIRDGFNLGVAQYPSYPERPNTYGFVSAGMVYVTKTSKHKNEAMLMLKEMMSDEVQLLASRKYARKTILQNPDVDRQFGKDLEGLSNIDLQSAFKSKAAPAPAFTQYTASARRLVMSKYIEFIEGKGDMNTALRAAEEEINKMIEAEKK
ncbi:ABC transporter substrate-binding protein [Paenibacillus oceani]|uniref:Extracellular solute-binding protein n=1 Tax=Paenibacillus oceani TaxID=2772510 RepID=A0A927H2W4_9BACL|nr:extracellular solute-binding protein [Paenibacillus oceani]MBD2865712.1 extracellular solute-binding protein [Paenibacillus oceani]